MAVTAAATATCHAAITVSPVAPMSQFQTRRTCSISGIRHKHCATLSTFHFLNSLHKI